MSIPQFPEIFLSHHEEQKAFVSNLYGELLQVQHNAFFDQGTRVDSLPEGIPFPLRILQACRACKLAVVVLSHDFIESLWPMLELQQFFFHNPHSPYILLLFCKLKPADLSKEENLTRWRTIWEESEASWKDKVQHMHTEDFGTSSSISDSQPMLDISLWPKALERLRSQSGQTLPDNKDELPFIRAIVSNICNMFPPPQSFVMGDHFQGAAHIQEEVHNLFQQQQSYPEFDDSGGKRPICVGLHGVGGSGKTIVCKYMLNFYAREYPGSCWFLQLPSKPNERHLLVQSMNDILSQHGNLNEETLKMIKTVEQAMRHFQDLLRRYRVFLVVDNIWDWALLDVKQILAMEYMKDSRLLLTARSRPVLQTLSPSFNNSDARGRPAKSRPVLQTLSPSFNDSDARGRPAMQIHHVPSISESEAVASLKAYSLFSCQQFDNEIYYLHYDLIKFCIFDGQCHPLLLKAVGTKLRHLGGSRDRFRDLGHLFSYLRDPGRYGYKGIEEGIDKDIEEEIVSVLRTSYDALNPTLQNILLLLGTCVPKQYFWKQTLENATQWLSMVYNDSGSQSNEEYIRAQIIELEYHGLLQLMDEEGRIVIHDLQRMMIDKIVQGNNDAPRRFFFEGDVTTLSKSQWMMPVNVSNISEIQCEMSENVSNMSEIQWEMSESVSNMSEIQWEMSESKWRSLKYIIGYGGGEEVLECFLDVEVLWLILGWPRAQLHLGRMQFLRYLLLSDSANVTEVRGWDGAPNLVSVELRRCERLKFIEPMTSLSSLKELKLSDLCSWQNTEGMLSSLSACTTLQRCILRSNPHICKFPSLTLTSMRVLDLSDCSRLRSLEGSRCGLTALEELSLSRCRSLESIPDLKQLVKLRRLMLKGCKGLKEAVNVGEATLEELSLHYGCPRLSTGSCSELPISAFSNLRKLWVLGEGWVSPTTYFHVGSISLPPSLEELYLSVFTKAQEMPDLSALVNLKRLEVSVWASLTSMTGLGPLTKLESLRIDNCNALREVRHVGPSSNLEDVHIEACDKLQILSIVFGFLRRYKIRGCPMFWKEKEMLPIEVSNSFKYDSLYECYGVEWVRE